MCFDVHINQHNGDTDMIVCVMLVQDTAVLLEFLNTVHYLDDTLCMCTEVVAYAFICKLCVFFPLALHYWPVSDYRTTACSFFLSVDYCL